MSKRQQVWVEARNLRVGDVVASMAPGRPFSFDVLSVEHGTDGTVSLDLSPRPCIGSGEDVVGETLDGDQQVFVTERGPVVCACGGERYRHPAGADLALCVDCGRPSIDAEMEA